MPIYLRHVNLCRSYCVRHVRHNLFDGKRVHPADRVLGEVFIGGFGVSVSKKSERPIGKDAALRFLEHVDGMVEAPDARTGAEHATLRGL